MIETKTTIGKHRKGVITSTLVFAMVLTFVFHSHAQTDTTYWRKGTTGALTFTQTSFSNWAGGGANSIAFNAYLNVFADYAKNKTTWENNLDLGYGLVDQEGTGFRKSDDRIALSSKFGHRIKKDLFWSTLIDYKTQFAPGFDFSNDAAGVETQTKISDIFAPAFLVVSTGLEWKPSKHFSLFYSPLSGKFTFVNANSLKPLFNVELDKSVRSEVGTYLRSKFKKELVKNVSLESRLELFTAYNESFGNIDVNWENFLIMKINDWLTTNFITQLIYDDDITIEGKKSRIQFKQIFGIGLTYSVGDKKKKK